MRISALTGNIGMSNLFLNKATYELGKSNKRLSTGKKLTQDMVGELGKLSNLKSHKMQIEKQTSNLQSAKDFANVRDGALAQITELAQKISEEYVADTVNQDVITAYTEEITNILSNTEYNGQKVFQAEDISFGSAKITKSSLVNDSGSTLDFSDATTAKASLNTIVKEVGLNAAITNGIDANISINTTMLENVESNISRIEDVDIATENMRYQELTTRQTLAAAMISKAQDNQANLINFLI